MKKERSQLIENNVNAVRGMILEAERWLWANPQTGYREWKAHEYLAEKFEELGYQIHAAGDIPGFYTDLDTGIPGPKVLILGELDSLICEDHPEADPQTGAVHCCGHHAQCAALLGVAAALKAPGALDGLSGSVRLCVVPAEELIEIDYRSGLIKDGLIRYAGGKTEFLYRGYFDGVDLAFMIHTTAGENFRANTGSVGCLAKRVTYKGVSAHAGGSPWKGCNALYAATLGLQAINSVRETFQEKDLIRVHPIITQGGNAVNAIPDKVVLESYVRGSSLEAIEKTNKKVNQALCGAALSLGANIEIRDIPGYAPLINDKGMVDIAAEAVETMTGRPFVKSDVFGTGSTDMGDLSAVMPVVHPYVPGASGIGHGSNYVISDPETACVSSAKCQVAMLELLLENGAVRAKEIVQEFKPRFASREEYFSYIDGLFSEGDRIKSRFPHLYISMAADLSRCVIKLMAVSSRNIWQSMELRLCVWNIADIRKQFTQSISGTVQHLLHGHIKILKNMELVIKYM